MGFACLGGDAGAPSGSVGPLNEWTRAFIANKKAWIDLIYPFEDFEGPDPFEP